MDGKTYLTSYDWAVYNILKHELNTLEARDEEPVVREWLHERIEKLKTKIDEL